MKKKQKKITKHTKSFLSKQKAQQGRFLEAYGRLGRQNKACEETGLSQAAVWDWRKDPKFEAAYNEAESQIGKLCEDEAIRRAVEGVDRGVYYEGKRVAVEREYSDALLARILAARHRPYRKAEEDEAKVVPNVTVITYANTPSANNNNPPQLRTPQLPATDIKSYR